MLTKRQIKLVRRYCLGPVLAVVCLIVVAVITCLWLVLVMVNDMVFYAPLYNLGFWLYLALVGAYTLGFVVLFLVLRLGFTRPEWTEVVQLANAQQQDQDYSMQMAGFMGATAAGKLLKMSRQKSVKKLGGVVQAAAAAGAIATLAHMMGQMRQQAKAVAAVLGVKVPRAWRYVLPAVLVPVLLLTGVYVPHYVAAKQSTDRQRQVAAGAVFALQRSLRSGCSRVWADDPAQRYSEHGYDITGYLYAADDSRKSYVSVQVDNTGAICQVDYYVDVNPQLTTEENIEHVHQDMAQLNALLTGSGVQAVLPALLQTTSLPQGFVDQFVQHPYDQDLLFRADQYTFVSYKAGDDPYIYCSIEE